MLGFDTVRSTDHEWGPRLLLFLSETAAAAHGPAIVETLRQTLPHEIRGYPTKFGPTHEVGVTVLQPVETGPVEHKVGVTTLPRFLQERLGITEAHQLDILDWLTFSEQALLEGHGRRTFPRRPRDASRNARSPRLLPALTGFIFSPRSGRVSQSKSHLWDGPERLETNWGRR